jgi:hypothetical protein
MTDRELMQQARDAMRNAAYDEEGYTLDADLAEAHDALDARLAHCDRCGKRLGGEGDIHTCSPDPIGDAQSALIAEMAAQPEQQEPVAWMYQCTTDNKGPVLLQQKQNWAESGTGLWVESPLYTTPPAAAQHQCKWPTCQSDEYQQKLAEQINQEFVAGAAQRQLVGLTKYERAECWYGKNCLEQRPPFDGYAEAIEAKLKEKNT